MEQDVQRKRCDIISLGLLRPVNKQDKEEWDIEFQWSTNKLQVRLL